MEWINRVIEDMLQYYINQVQDNRDELFVMVEFV